MENIIYVVPFFGIIALIYTAIKSAWVSKQDAGNEKMTTIAKYIADGAMAFLKAEYKVLSYYVIIASIFLFYMGTTGTNSSPLIVVAFVMGAIFSVLAGFIGMRIATKANVRTAQAARTSLSKALAVSFGGGSVMGMGVAGLAILGLGSLFIVFKMIFVKTGNMNGPEMEKALEVLTGFSLGSESIALFARVGGGIYTKAADVGADLVGKVEAGIPEDDPRNPATIADNVGDNVGDVAGMGADLFGSYVATILATMVLGREIKVTDNFGGISPILLPLVIAGMGSLFSIIATFFVKVKEGGNVQKALNIGNWSAVVMTAIASFFLIRWMLPASLTLRDVTFTSMGVFYAVLIGLTVGTLISIVTEYYCSMGKGPVNSIVQQSSTGHATNIIAGLSVGMMSTALPILILAFGIVSSYAVAGLYGVAIAAAGMMATTAMQLAIDAFGPIADNAGGIAEMSELPKDVREKTDILDAVGNTTAATGKGFAIASAALTSLALFAAFMGAAHISVIDISNAKVLAGLFIGGVIPFVFSALAISAVGRAAMAMVQEVRRQFREIKGIMEGTGKPEYDKCVAISTKAAIREMMLPGALALVVPVIVGFAFGPEVLGGVLAGVTVSGVLMAIFQSNAGGAWDNAKKSFEKGVDINGEKHFKGSDPHKASITGDTVGDPFKDTSGPSMNILIKLMSIVSLVIAPHLVQKIDLPTSPVSTTTTQTTIDSTKQVSQNIATLNGTFVLSKAHSFVNFTIGHMLSEANGIISIDTGFVKLGSDLKNSDLEVNFSVKSINTNNDTRNGHVQSADFLNSDSFPTITFKASDIELAVNNPNYKYIAKGNLTIKNVTKAVDVPFNYVGVDSIQMKDRTFKTYTFAGEFSLNRTDYNVGKPSMMVGSAVKIKFSVETAKM